MSRGSWSLVLLVGGLVACSGGFTDAPADPVALEPVSLPTSLDVLGFRPAGGLAWLDETTLVLIDRDDQQLVALDVESAAERRAGRRGAGPGEIENGLHLVSIGDGVLVLDMALKRLSEFDGDLVFRGSQPVPGIPLSIVDIEDRRARVLWLSFDAAGPAPRVGRIDMRSGKATDVFGLFVEGGLNRPAESSPFEPMFFSAAPARGGAIVAGLGSEYRLVRFDAGGAPGAVFGRPELEQEPVTGDRVEARRQAAARVEMRMGPTPPGLEGTREAALNRPDGFFAANAFARDDAGRLWVVTTRRAADSTGIDLFGPDGRFLQTIPLRDVVRAVAFRGDRVAVLVTRTASDIEGYAGIDVYRLR